MAWEVFYLLVNHIGMFDKFKTHEDKTAPNIILVQLNCAQTVPTSLSIGLI